MRGTSFCVQVTDGPDGYITRLSTLHGTVSIQLYDENGNPKGEPVSVPEGMAVAVFTEIGIYSAESASVYGDAYFIFITEDGYVPVAEGENPVFALDGDTIPDSIKEQALKSDENGLLRLRISVAEELRGEKPAEQTTTSAPETTAPVTTTTTTAPVTTTTVASTIATETEITTTTEATTATEATTTTEAATTEVTTTTEATTTEVTTTTEATTTVETTTATEETTSVTETTIVTTTTTTLMVTRPPVIMTPPPYTGTTPPVTTQPAVKTYTVDFLDENGNQIYSEEVEENGTVSFVPEVSEKTGYTGIWMYKDEEFSDGPITKDMTVTPLYIIEIYTVTYTCEGMDSITEEYEYGATFEVSEPPSKMYYTSVWTCDGAEYDIGQTVTVVSDMEFVVEFIPVKVEMQVMLPNYSFGSSYAQYDIITIDYGKPLDENDRGISAEELLQYYDNPHTLYPDQMLDTWSRYTAVSAEVGSGFDIADNPVIDENIISISTDENGETVYTTTIYITYGYREFTVTYLMPGYGTEHDENGYGIYQTEAATYENYYHVLSFPDGYDGYWSLEQTGTDEIGSMSISEDTVIYGVLRT